MSSFIVPARKPVDDCTIAQKQTFTAQPCALVGKAMILASRVEHIILEVYGVY